MGTWRAGRSRLSPPRPPSALALSPHLQPAAPTLTSGSPRYRGVCVPRTRHVCTWRRFYERSSRCEPKAFEPDAQPHWHPPSPSPPSLTCHPRLPPSPATHAPAITRHAEGVVHRDIKPSNVLLNEQHEGRLGDFGLAARLPDDGQRLRTRARACARGRSRSRTATPRQTPRQYSTRASPSAEAEA